MGRINRWGAGIFLVAITLAWVVSFAWAQSTARTTSRPRSVTVRASTAYDHGAVWRLLFGDEWRDVWAAEITVPVLDLDDYAGGLTPYKEGGNQSKTLRFHGADGRTYVFRSTAKTMKKAPSASIAQDQTAALHPTGVLAASELQDAVGILHPAPQLVYMPDDERLGEYREDFANTLGSIEERPDEYKGGGAFAGADKIVDTESLIDHLEASSEDRLDSRDYLKVRLIDFLIGDTDRGADQWHFAKFEHGEHDVYRPVPRDRDYAFLKVQGPLPAIARAIHPRFVCFNEHYPKLASLCYMTGDFDRSVLVDLDWPTWDSIAMDMQRKLDDETIDRAIAQLPEAHQELSGDELARGLKARRDALRTVAHEYYRMVSHEADVFASDEPEHVDIERHADGSVTVRMWRNVPQRKPDAVAVSAPPPRAAPVFERRFVPDETREIRVYLERGNDRAVVHGRADETIRVRVTGGEGDDVLEDQSDTHGTATYFYDASGRNTFIPVDQTRVVTKPFATESPRHFEDEGKAIEHSRVLDEERRGRQRDLMQSSGKLIDDRLPRYWGEAGGFTPMTGYRESGGVLLGFGPTITRYGFRRQPYAWRAGLHGMVGTRNGELGVRLTADRYFEQSGWSLALLSHVTNLESNRFYGYGNNTALLDADETLIERFEILVRPSLRYRFGSASSFDFGPVLKYVDPQLPAGSPATLESPLGSEPFGQLGVRADLVLDRTVVDEKQQSGLGLDTGVSAYPAAWDASESFGEAHALARAFIPLWYPTLALRAGGQRAWGTFPMHESAFIGGRWTLRGFRWNRFAGDASAYGSAELRVPVAKINLFAKGQLGVLGFVDAGRVWLDGDSPGGWHTAGGGGLWFGSAARQAAVTYAKGDEHRVYFYLGMPF